MDSPHLFIDSDAFVFLARTGLFEKAIQILGFQLSDCSRLHALPYMVRDDDWEPPLSDSEMAEVLRVCELVPSFEERPTLEIEELLTGITGIDSGEVLLFGVVAEAQTSVLMTGDKRALIALGGEPSLLQLHARLAGRVVCLERVLLMLSDRHTVQYVAASIAEIRDHDDRLRSVFSDGNVANPEQAMEGLRSYLRKLSNFDGVEPLLFP